MLFGTFLRRGRSALAALRTTKVLSDGRDADGSADGRDADGSAAGAVSIELSGDSHDPAAAKPQLQSQSPVLERGPQRAHVEAARPQREPPPASRAPSTTLVDRVGGLRAVVLDVVPDDPPDEPTGLEACIVELQAVLDDLRATFGPVVPSAFF